MDPAHLADQRDPRARGAVARQPLRDPPPLSAPAGDRFGALQVELPWPLGPADGRHSLRGPDGEIAQVVVVETIASARRGRARRRARALSASEAADPAPATVPLARVTVIFSGRPLTERQADTWLAAAGVDELREGLAALGRLLHAHRVVTADPGAPPLSRARLLAARVGCGDGPQVAAGRFARARELPLPGPRGMRRRVPAADARLASALAGREPLLAGEELALRARADLDAGRPREAALQLVVALDTACAELSAETPARTPASALTQLRDHREAVAAVAQVALTAVPTDDARAEIAAVLAQLEAVLRARAAAGG